MTIRHAFDCLSDPPDRWPDVVGVFGNDSTLRRWALGAVAGNGDLTQFDGTATSWGDINDDLSTASLFDAFDGGGGTRTIAIRDADAFVSKHRAEVEGYVAKPSGATRLVLELSSLASNTRLYKSLDKQHLLVACGNGNDAKRGVTAATRRKFITGYVAGRHEAKLTRDAADAIVDMVGEDIGMIDVSVAKLAVHLPPGETIGEDLARDVVAGWQGKTVWQITDAIASGDAAEAMRQLDKLLAGGEKPIALLPQIAWSLRRLGMAASVVQQRDDAGRKIGLEDALSMAGIHRPGEIQSAKKHLIGMGRARALKLLPWLLDADLRLKGTHSNSPRDRMLLEQFVLRLAK